MGDVVYGSKPIIDSSNGQLFQWVYGEGDDTVDTKDSECSFDGVANKFVVANNNNGLQGSQS